jgi:hypothetical protein
VKIEIDLSDMPHIAAWVGDCVDGVKGVFCIGVVSLYMQEIPNGPPPLAAAEAKCQIMHRASKEKETKS